MLAANNWGMMIKCADQGNETTHCHDMMRKSESLPGYGSSAGSLMRKVVD
jgi:hypothetical protein